MDAAERRRSNASSSPDFQFWPVDAGPAASPSCADELFAGGVLLPLPILPPRAAAQGGQCSFTEKAPEQEDAQATVAAAAASIASPAPPAVAGGGSKRWTDIFAKKPAEEKERRKDGAGSGRKPAASAAGVGGGGGGSELNINIWPFSRSRSAGGGGGSGSSKPRPPLRKASSAPCSRSNSRGEAAAAAPLPPPRRWAASPGRAGGGVPVGRSSPVWQIKRPVTKHAPTDHPSGSDRRTHHKDKPAVAAGGGGKKSSLGSGGGMRGINLSVNSCIGYRHQVSCRRVDAGSSRSPGDGGGGGLFGIKGLFSKKVH